MHRGPSASLALDLEKKMADLSLRDLRQAERQEDVGQGDRLVGAKRQGSLDLRPSRGCSNAFR